MKNQKKNTHFSALLRLWHNGTELTNLHLFSQMKNLLELGLGYQKDHQVGQ